MNIDETTFYSKFSKFLRDFFKCHYSDERRILWGKQPDVLGVRFEVKGGLALHLYLVEVKILNSLEAAYNLIGEMETRIASFRKYNTIFYSLHPYLGALEINSCKEIREYAENRRVGIIRVEGNSLSFERESTPIFSNKILSNKDLKEQGWIKDDGEARILKEVMKVIDWQCWKSILESSSIYNAW
jgi:hypothetical protein